MTVVLVTVLLWAEVGLCYLVVTFKQHFSDLRALCNFCLRKQPKKKRISALITLAYAEKNPRISSAILAPLKLLKTECATLHRWNTAVRFTLISAAATLFLPGKLHRLLKLCLYENYHLSQNSTTSTTLSNFVNFFPLPTKIFSRLIILKSSSGTFRGHFGCLFKRMELQNQSLMN